LLKINNLVWSWNNGHWRQSNESNEITIDLFSTRGAEKSFGILYIGKIKISDGLTLGANSREQGEGLLLKFAIENQLVEN